MSDPEIPQKRRGCFFYGCITSICLAVVLGIIGFFGIRQIVNYVNEQILEYTETAPMTLPKVEMTSAELDKLKERVTAFGNALDAHTNTPPLILSGREITALLANIPEVKGRQLDDKFYFNMESNQIKAQVSIPLGERNAIPFIKSRGRYLNGTAGLEAGVSNGTIIVNVKSMEAKGKQLPVQFVTQLQQFEQKDINEQINSNPTNHSLMTNIESVEVKDGTLIIKAKQP